MFLQLMNVRLYNAFAFYNTFVFNLNVKIAFVIFMASLVIYDVAYCTLG